MASLKADFDELIHRIEAGREFAHASFEPIFYLVFHPTHILEVKRQTPAWKSKLENSGFCVETFSIAKEINEILTSAPLRGVWLDADRKNPFAWEKSNASLSNALVAQSRLQTRLEERLDALANEPSTVLLVTDLEALHPYIRIGAIEAQLQGKFRIPTVFLYPGSRTGKTRLRFLGFYPEDGNYRSVHVGG
jgi:hypothetical protein